MMAKKSRQVVGAKAEGNARQIVGGNAEAYDYTGKAEIVAGALAEEESEQWVMGSAHAFSGPQLANEILQVLQNLTEAVVDSQQLSSSQISALLSEIKELHQQVLLPPPKRAKERVTQAITAITTAIQVGGAMAEIWNVWGQPIRTFFGL